MKSHFGSGVSRKTPVICVVDAYGEYLREGACESVPTEIACSVHGRVPEAYLIGFETGPLAGLALSRARTYGLSILCLHALCACRTLMICINQIQRALFALRKSTPQILAYDADGN